MRMTGYEAFTLHIAINLHFNGSYDCFKYNFKTNVTEKTYWKRPDKFQLTKIGKRFHSDFPMTTLKQLALNPQLFDEPNIDCFCRD